MLDLKSLQEKAMSEGMKLMGNPRVMKFMGTPRGQKLMAMAFQLPQQIDGALDARAKKIAKMFRLATRAEVKTMKETIRGLEQTIQSMQAKIEKNGHAK